MRRLVPSLLALALLLGACGDDGTNDPPPSTAATTPTAPTESTVAGPTEGSVACAQLADRYVRRARSLFTQEGTPSDALVDSTRERLAEFDAIAATAGCGPAYTTGVCDGLDALSAEGILVLYPLTTAQCL